MPDDEDAEVRVKMEAAIAALLWFLVIGAAITVLAMFWHPWVHPWTGVPK